MSERFPSIECVCRRRITLCMCGDRGCSLPEVSLCLFCTALLTYPPASLMSTLLLLSKGLFLRYKPGPYIHGRYHFIAFLADDCASSCCFFLTLQVLQVCLSELFHSRLESDSAEGKNQSTDSALNSLLLERVQKHDPGTVSENLNVSQLIMTCASLSRCQALRWELVYSPEWGSVAWKQVMNLQND